MKLAAIFKDGMVLQRNKQNRIWGTCEGSEVIKITFAGRTYITKGLYDKESRETGIRKWHIDLMPLKEGGPHTMIVEGKGHIVIKDILIGDVWFAGGQSNMELELQNSKDGLAVIEESDFNSIRFYNVPKIAVVDDELIKAEAKTEWKYADSEKIKDVSAVAYYFARKLNRELNVPIGIIDCYWGGTSATCWAPKEEFRNIEGAHEYLKEWEDVISTKSDETYKQEMDAYNDEYNAWCKRVDDLKKEDPDINWEVINEKAGLCPWPQPMGGRSPFRPYGLYESMVKRVIPYGIKGFIYYQAEEDWSRKECYDLLNKAVIDTWRRDFGIFDAEELPFIITQLPMYIAKGEKDILTFTGLRDKQALLSRREEGVGLACLIDCGEFDNIHPLDKKTPGERLALQALGMVYKKTNEYKNMRINKAYMDGDTLRVSLMDTYGGIRVRSTDGKILTANVKDEVVIDNNTEINNEEYKIYGFEITSDGENFKKSDAVIDGKEVCIKISDCNTPNMVRYGWTDFGVVNLYNNIGLPLEPDLIKVENARAF